MTDAEFWRLGRMSCEDSAVDKLQSAGKSAGHNKKKMTCLFVTDRDSTQDNCQCLNFVRLKESARGKLIVRSEEPSQVGGERMVGRGKARLLRGVVAIGVCLLNETELVHQQSETLSLAVNASQTCSSM